MTRFYFLLCFLPLTFGLGCTKSAINQNPVRSGSTDAKPEKGAANLVVTLNKSDFTDYNVVTEGLVAELRFLGYEDSKKLSFRDDEEELSFKNLPENVEGTIEMTFLEGDTPLLIGSKAKVTLKKGANAITLRDFELAKKATVLDDDEELDDLAGSSRWEIIAAD